MTPDELWLKTEAYLPKLIAAAPVALLVLVAGMALNLIVSRALRLLAHRTSLTDADVLPLRNIARWLIRGLTVILVLGVFGFELGGLWTIMSTVFAMVAIGFVAVWSILSNTSATVLILIMRPFGIGDLIELPSENVKGLVVDLNFFFTTVQVDQDTSFRVPNNLFFQKVIKRTPGNGTISLAQQLSNSHPANIPLPPPESQPPPAEKKPVSASEDFAAKSIPDPGSMGIPDAAPPSRGR